MDADRLTDKDFQEKYGETKYFMIGNINELGSGRALQRIDEKQYGGLPTIYNAEAENKQLPAYFNDPNIPEAVKRLMYNQRIAGNISGVEAGLISQQKPEEQKEIYEGIKNIADTAITKQDQYYGPYKPSLVDIKTPMKENIQGAKVEEEEEKVDTIDSRDFNTCT
jgi:hypothetical protein